MAASVTLIHIYILVGVGGLWVVGKGGFRGMMPLGSVLWENNVRRKCSSLHQLFTDVTQVNAGGM